MLDIFFRSCTAEDREATMRDLKEAFGLPLDGESDRDDIIIGATDEPSEEDLRWMDEDDMPFESVLRLPNVLKGYRLQVGVRDDYWIEPYNPEEGA